MIFTELSKGDYIIFIPNTLTYNTNITIYRIGNVSFHSLWDDSYTNLKYNITFKAIELGKEINDIDDIKSITLEHVSDDANIAYQDGGRYELFPSYLDKGKEKEHIQLLFDTMIRTAKYETERKIEQCKGQLNSYQRTLDKLNSLKCPEYKEFENNI